MINHKMSNINENIASRQHFVNKVGELLNLDVVYDLDSLCDKRC